MIIMSRQNNGDVIDIKNPAGGKILKKKKNVVAIGRARRSPRPGRPDHGPAHKLTNLQS